ncbi:hypothetical protein CKAN_00365700 [Cinnamomum micranthum f. kanehirae]|uniref:Disease resistance R13L4/SHOC-2-like LRR domain-containing protein n=1 Tax=Cinnamomum micranthum f. kanehirae TaxID=337451 RepID=A0A3S4NCA2_9MAGN|nr:hypothetical protein CKAN_00365700 [Cinnamomum micranthum f. kanehirae]
MDEDEDEDEDGETDIDASISVQIYEKLKDKRFLLVLGECHNLKVMHEECFELMDRLRVLDLSGTEIDSLPWSVFKLYNLQQLLLRGCRALKSLPSSLSDSVNLEKLNLRGCISLKTGVSPQSLQNLTSLEELDLSECEQLEDIRVASFHDILPKLRRSQNR